MVALLQRSAAWLGMEWGGALHGIGDAAGDVLTAINRLKGKGLHGNGDLYASLKIALPEKGDPDLESLMRFWRDQKPYKVRD